MQPYLEGSTPTDLEREGPGGDAEESEVLSNTNERAEAAAHAVGQVDLPDSPKPPLKFKIICSWDHTTQKKWKKLPVNGFGLDFYVCYYKFPSNQGQFTEVPLNFEIFAIKVVGQTI